jgi:C1q domain-containing protein
MRNNISAVLTGALIICASAQPAFALGDAFDAASMQVPGQTQKFNGLQDGTDNPVQFPVVYTNAGGRYSPATYKYTAASNGIYLFAADVSFAMNGDGENQCELALYFLIEAPNGQSSSARFVASDIVMTPPGGYLPGGYNATHTAGTMIRRVSAGSNVSVTLSVGSGCVGEVHPLQGAHFSGGRM